MTLWRAAGGRKPVLRGERHVEISTRHWAWAALMRRAFDLDVLACPRCGGRLRWIATAKDPEAIRAILAALAEVCSLASWDAGIPLDRRPVLAEDPVPRWLSAPRRRQGRRGGGAENGGSVNLTFMLSTSFPSSIFQSNLAIFWREARMKQSVVVRPANIFTLAGDPLFHT